MAGNKDKPLIRLDYAALGGNPEQDSEIPVELVKKAQSWFLGRGWRQEVLRLMDQSLRVHAAEVAKRQMDPLRLYAVGRQAVLEAIKLYRFKQHGDFREFATAYARQTMTLAKNKTLPEATPLAPPPLRGEIVPPPEPPRPE
jgi:hypothetical protein